MMIAHRSDFGNKSRRNESYARCLNDVRQRIAQKCFFAIDKLGTEIRLAAAAEVLCRNVRSGVCKGKLGSFLSNYNILCVCVCGVLKTDIITKRNERFTKLSPSSCRSGGIWSVAWLTWLFRIFFHGQLACKGNQIMAMFFSCDWFDLGLLFVTIHGPCTYCLTTQTRDTILHCSSCYNVSSVLFSSTMSDCTLWLLPWPKETATTIMHKIRTLFLSWDIEKWSLIALRCAAMREVATSRATVPISWSCWYCVIRTVFWFYA